MQANSKKIKYGLFRVGVDPALALSALFLVMIGVLMVASASIAIAEKYNHDPLHYLKRHVMFIAIGLVAAGIALRLSTEWVQRLSRLMMLLCLVALILVLVPGIGVTVNGAQRWLNLGVSRFQVVEAVKLALIVYLASYAVRHKLSLQQAMFGVIKPLMLTMVIALLLLLQPDFGSAVLLLMITIFMVFLAGARYRDMTVLSILAASSMAVIAWAEPYRMKRLVNFIDPWQDPFNAGFQLVQALIAIGRGEFAGVGIGGSVQKLFYLPEAHTDFIFAVYAEETGFFGVLLMVLLFTVLLLRVFSVARTALNNGQEFSGFMVAGIGVWLSLQAFFSMGVNLGLLPTKGLTLPFISSGGSAIMVNLAALGLVARVSYENRKQSIKAIRSGGGR